MVIQLRQALFFSAQYNLPFRVLVALLVANVAAILQRFNREDKLPNCRFLRVSLFSSS